MKRLLVALIAGALFGAGLVLSDMANPARVLAFLDVWGDWDPSLAYVMGAALAVSAVGWRLRLQRQQPICAARFDVPTRRDVDARLISGAVLFGLGWGLVGLCPGPALVGLVLDPTAIAPFVAALLVGMALYRWTLDRGAT